MSVQIIIKPTSVPREKGFVNWTTVNEAARKIIEQEKRK